MSEAVESSPVVDEQSGESAGAEVEIWWGGFAGRTFLPSFVGCALLTPALVGIGFLLVNGTGVRPSLVRWCDYYLTLSIWLIQFARWGYCLAAFNYRLTTRRFYCGGFLFKPIEPVDLASVVDLDVHQSLLERVLGVGHIGISRDHKQPEVVFLGVADPHRIADLIADQAEKARKAAG